MHATQSSEIEMLVMHAAGDWIAQRRKHRRYPFFRPVETHVQVQTRSGQHAVIIRVLDRYNCYIYILKLR